MKVGDLLKCRAPFKREGVWMVVGIAPAPGAGNATISLVCPDRTLKHVVELHAEYNYTVLT